MIENHPDDLQLSAYHDGELPADHHAAMSVHLAWCEACMKRIDQLRQISALLASNAPDGLSQISLRRIHSKLDEVIERGLIRWAWEVSGIAAAVLLAGSIWLAKASDPSVAASVPPWVVSQASADPVVSDAPTPAAAWYLADSRNSSDVNP